MATREIDIPTFGPNSLTDETLNCLSLSFNHCESEDELLSRMNSMIARRWHRKLQQYIGSLGIFIMYYLIFVIFGTGIYHIGKEIIKAIIK